MDITLVGFITVLALIICSDAQSQDFQLESAAFFKPHKGMTSYEVSAKLIYKVQLPSFSANDPGNCEGSDVQCVSEKSIFNRKQEWLEMLRSGQSSALPKSRAKRQAVVVAALAGFLLHSVYTSLSKKMFGSDNEAERQIQMISWSMKAQQHQFLVFRNSVELYSQNLSRVLNASWWSDTTLEQQSRSHLYLTQVNAYMDRLHFGLARCSSNLIPFQFLPKDFLHTKLVEIEKHASSFGYHLSITPDNIDEYTDINIADCMFTETGVNILINVPMLKDSWDIFEMIPIPFGYGNQTCTLESRHTDLVAINMKEVKVLDLNSRQFCDLFRNKLCLIPIFQRPTEQSAQCVSYVYRKSTIENIGSACQFKCYPSSGPTITYLDANLVSVSNGKSLTVECPLLSNRLPLHSFGALNVALKCNCTYKVDNINIQTYGSCTDLMFATADISKTIPHFLMSPSMTSTNYDIHHNWTKIIPILNFTQSQSQDNLALPSGYFDDTLTTNHRDIILITNSTIASFLLIFAVVLVVVLWKNLHK